MTKLRVFYIFFTILTIYSILIVGRPEPKPQQRLQSQKLRDFENVQSVEKSSDDLESGGGGGGEDNDLKGSSSYGYGYYGYGLGNPYGYGYRYSYPSYYGIGYNRFFRYYRRRYYGYPYYGGYYGYY